MHAKPDLRENLKWMIADSGSVITDVIRLMKPYLLITMFLLLLMGCHQRGDDAPPVTPAEESAAETHADGENTAAGILSGGVAFGDELAPQRIALSGPAGEYTTQRWKADWPGCIYEDGIKEGHASLYTTGDGSALRIDYVIGQIGPEKGGVGWRYPIARSVTAELSYTLTFSEDFDWVKGGKLPGLCGGPESVTGGNRADGENGFSARLMWRSDGRGEAYVYHMNQSGNYGDSFAFPSDFRFPTSKRIKIRMRLVLNTPGQRDGSLDVWVSTPNVQNEQSVVSRSDMQWRSNDDIAIDGILFETFHGGGDNSWAPRRPSFTLFRDIEFSEMRQKNGG